MKAYVVLVMMIFKLRQLFWRVLNLMHLAELRYWSEESLLAVTSQVVSFILGVRIWIFMLGIAFLHWLMHRPSLFATIVIEMMHCLPFKKFAAAALTAGVFAGNFITPSPSTEIGVRSSYCFC